MSLAGSKGSLFGTGTVAASAISGGVKSKTAGMSFGFAAPTMSAAEKAKKTEEAKAAEAKAMQHLQTSVFQWSPDYLSASVQFENASKAYKIVGDLETAKKMMIKVMVSIVF